MRWLAACLLAGVLLGGLWWWWRQSRTLEELFRARCSACHEVPDLSGYAREDMGAIVRTMRERNGADTVIDDEEARVIIDYLERRARR